MKYPLAAPVLLASAAACILSGSLHPPIAGAALGWGAPACFLATTLVMIAASGNLSLSSAVLMLASLLGLANAACRDLALPDLLADGCGAAAALPPPVRPLLALAGPALLVLRHGFADPVLTTWLAASAVGVVPALPVEIREVLWQPGVVSGALTLACACFMLRTRGPVPLRGALHALLTCVAAAMLGPCLHHLLDLAHLAQRVADLGPPFDAMPMPWAVAVCATETLGSLLIVLRLAPRAGALLLLPKMAVATWGHAFVEGFDAKFAASYANAFTPPGLSYNWSLGASWECGFFGAGYFLLAYASILLLPPATGTPKAKSKTA